MQYFFEWAAICREPQEEAGALPATRSMTLEGSRLAQIVDLLIIGGGAAGLWAAGTAAARGLDVLLLEKNRKLGVKILMSGGTRCNITHHCDVGGILDAFGREQGRFLKHAVYALPPSEVVDVIQSLGVKTKVESTGKVFPVSDRAIDVRNALVDRAHQRGAQLISGMAVSGVQRAQDWRVHCENGESFDAHQLLICCGGLSYPGCGTCGDGYAWAQALGHSLLPTRPALAPLVCGDNWAHELKGLTLPDVSARIDIPAPQGAKKSKRDARMTSRGGFLWTHFGFSGPAPMNVSRFVPHREDASGPSMPSTDLVVDLLPELSHDELNNHLIGSGPDHSSKSPLSSVLQAYVPKRLAFALLERAKVQPALTLAELPKRARQGLTADLKDLRFTISGTRGYAKAEVTRGGIDLSEINPRTMESRQVPGLFFAGEILDVDGPIGGFNFQAAFSTGHLAANNAQKKHP